MKPNILFEPFSFKVTISAVGRGNLGAYLIKYPTEDYPAIAALAVELFWPGQPYQIKPTQMIMTQPAFPQGKRLTEDLKNLTVTIETMMCRETYYFRIDRVK